MYWTFGIFQEVGQSLSCDGLDVQLHCQCISTNSLGVASLFASVNYFFSCPYWQIDCCFLRCLAWSHTSWYMPPHHFIAGQGLTIPYLDSHCFLYMVCINCLCLFHNCSLFYSLLQCAFSPSRSGQQVLAGLRSTYKHVGFLDSLTFGIRHHQKLFAVLFLSCGTFSVYHGSSVFSSLLFTHSSLCCNNSLLCFINFKPTMKGKIFKTQMVVRTVV